MRSQFIQPYGLSRVGRHAAGGAPPPALEVFDIAEGTIAPINLTDAASVTFTATDIGGTSTQIAQSMGSRVIAWDVGLAIGAEDIHIRHEMVTTAAGTVAFGMSTFDGTNRTRVQFYPSNGNVWVIGTAGQTGNIATGVGPNPYSASTTIVADYIFRPGDNSVSIFISFGGQAPFAFRLTGIAMGSFQLLTFGNSTIVHTLTTRALNLPASLAVDPAIMHSPLAFTERGVPAGFTAAIPGGYRFYEDGGAYHSSVSLTPPLAETDAEVLTIHVDLATGADTNPGTAAAPLKSLHVAANRFQLGGRVIIKAKGGLYPYAHCFRNYLKGAALQIVSWDGGEIVSSMHDATLSWSASGGAHVATLPTGSVDSVFDAAFQTDGDYQPLTRATDIANCQATAGTWFQSGTSVYVHTSDNRAPDGDLRVYTREVGGATDIVGLRQTVNGSVLYMEKLRLEGGYYPCQLNSASSSGYLTLYARDSAVKYCGNLSGFSVTSNGLVVTQNCVAAMNMADGFNYKPSSAGGAAALAIEIGCIGRANGRDASGTSNGSSSHGAPVIRVGGSYQGNRDRNLHDIDQGGNRGLSWNLGCTASDPQTADANFATGILAGTDTTLMWLDGCTSSGGAVDLQANAGTVIRTAGFSGDATNEVNDGGTITTYTP